MVRQFALMTVLFAFACHGDAVSGAPPIGAQPGVLLLRNGQVLSGRITLEGNRYIVTQGECGEVRLPVEQVELHCQSLEEAYQRKCAALSSDINDRLDLVEWCLRQSCYSQGADQLLKALAIDPKHPRIALLERRLRMAIETPDPPETTTPQTPSQLNLYELERVVRDVPEAAIESFTATVQPLLLNRCGAGACHGTGTESSFRLVRPTWGKTLPRRFTQRNLYATLQQVDKQRPEDSALLIAPSEPHGTLGSPVFGTTDQAQFKTLIDWVRQVTIKSPAPAPSTIAPAASRLIQASYNQPVGLPTATTAATGTRTAAGSGQSGGDDPFDPERFNRRFFPAPAAVPK